MTDTSAPHTDPGLEGNEKIEAAILALQQEASQELLAHALTVLRRRMRENRSADPGCRAVCGKRAARSENHSDTGWQSLVGGFYQF